MSHPYERLTPDLILDAVADVGLQPDGHLLALFVTEVVPRDMSLLDTVICVGELGGRDGWALYCAPSLRALAGLPHRDRTS